jgi:hypothetical protein
MTCRSALFIVVGPHMVRHVDSQQILAASDAYASVFVPAAGLQL